MHTSRQNEKSLRQLALPLIFAIVCLWALSLFEGHANQTAFISSEVTFTDASPSGLQILPASCASAPWYYHNDLSYSSDEGGYVSDSGQTEYGGSKYYDGTTLGVVCVTNDSGGSYFIPAETTDELQTFIDQGSNIPGVDAWGWIGQDQQ